MREMRNCLRLFSTTGPPAAGCPVHFSEVARSVEKQGDGEEHNGIC